MERVIPRGTRSSFATCEIRYDDGRKDEIVSFRGTRVGLHWPTANSPGFYVIAGESVKGNIIGGFSLRLLREGQDQIPSKLYEELADDAGVFGIREIFADTEKFDGYVLDFIAFKRRERPRQPLYLKLAPFHQDFSHGVFTIREWVKKNSLIIPKESVVHDQLKNITSQDLKGNPEEKFFAVDALRLVIGSFKVFNMGPLEDARDRFRSPVAPPVSAFT
jgi:hypothetical protein